MRLKMGMPALLLALTAMSAGAVDGIGVSLGRVVTPGGRSGIGDVRISADWQLPWQWWESPGGVLQSRFELGAGHSETALNPVWSATATPLLHYQFHGGRSGWGPFIEVGAGVAWLSQTRWADNHDLHSHWQFDPLIGVGYALGTHELSLRLQHFSNADLDPPNPGGNVFALRYRYAFQ